MSLLGQFQIEICLVHFKERRMKKCPFESFCFRGFFSLTIYSQSKFHYFFINLHLILIEFKFHSIFLFEWNLIYQINSLSNQLID